MTCRYAAAALLLGCVLRASDVTQNLATLAHDRDPERLDAAAVAIVESDNGAAIARLARLLSEPPFLARLDRGTKIVHLGHVFRALTDHPSMASASLCIALANDPNFGAIPARLNFLLNALAAVRPMSEAAAKVFRETSKSGYAEVNGPLLARNGSPNALDVLESLLTNESLDGPERVSIAHWSLLPVRTDGGVIAMCARILDKPVVSQEVQIAILESLYDYQPRLWFSLRNGQPSPPPWASATPAAADLLKSLAARSLKRQDLPPQLRTAIRSTLAQLG